MKIKKVLFVLVATVMAVSASLGLFTVSAETDSQLRYVVVESRREFYTGEGLGTSFGKYMSAPSTVEEAILEGLLDAQEEIDISQFGVRENKIADIFYKVVGSNPHLFYVSTGFGYSYMGDVVYSITPKYNMTEQQIIECVPKFNQAVQKVMDFVPDGATDVEKVLAVHDYIALNTEYDTSVYNSGAKTSDNSYTAYGALVDGVAVCQGYAFAFNCIMNMLDIENRYVSSDSMNHGWSIVKINGEWYHVDVTWDDPVNDKWGRVTHEFLLLSDYAISDSYHSHSGWNSDTPDADDYTFDNYFWENVSTAFLPHDGLWYYIGQGDGKIHTVKAYNFVTHAVNNVFTISAKWSAGGNSYWPSMTPFIATSGGRLYYNTPDSIKSCNFSGGDVQTLDITVDQGLQIFQMKISGNTVYYGLAAGLNDGRQVERSCPIGVLELKTDASVVIDRENGNVLLPFPMILAEFKTQFDVGADALKLYDGETEVESGFVGTGMSLVLKSGGKILDRLTVVSPGDVSGDGITDDADIRLTADGVIGAAPLEGIYFTAADISGDGVLDLTDLMIMRNIYLA